MMESLVQGKLARRVRWGGCRNVRSEKIAARCVLTQSMRERLATLTRKCRHSARRLLPLEMGMYLIGCTYNFCWVHQELSKSAHLGSACTPAMAAGLTNHIWSVCELLHYKVVLSPWVEPKRRERRKKQAEQTAIPAKRLSLRPLVPLRKGRLCSTTS
jgi:hypothetical protein